MNVTCVNNQYQLGGAETVVQQLRAGLRQLGHEAPLYIVMRLRSIDVFCKQFRT